MDILDSFMIYCGFRNMAYIFSVVVVLGDTAPGKSGKRLH